MLFLVVDHELGEAFWVSARSSEAALRKHGRLLEPGASKELLDDFVDGFFGEVFSFDEIADVEGVLKKSSRALRGLRLRQLQLEVGSEGTEVPE